MLLFKDKSRPVVNVVIISEIQHIWFVSYNSVLS